jgi:AraC family transcriptional regulator
MLMAPPDIEPAPPMTARLLAEGEGWRTQEVICRCGPDDQPFEERHGWTSVAAVLAGVFTYRTGPGRAILAPGALLLGEAGRCFECGHEHASGDRCVSFHFSPDFIDEILGGLKGARRSGFRRASVPPTERLLPLLAEARALAKAPDPLRAEQLALGVASAAFALDHDVAITVPSLSDEARAARAARIIEARYAEPLTIAGLAREVGLTRRRFATAFKAVVGATPYNYILIRRLEAAAERLRGGAGSTLEVALDTGFGDLSEFTRRFRARYGRPPGLYRRSVYG